LDLCLQPRAQRLFRPRAGSWRQFMQGHALGMLICAGLVPHAVLSVLNILFNLRKLIRSGAEAEAFKQALVVINPIAYGLGICLGVYLILPVLAAVRGFRAGRAPEAARLSALRRRSLWIGDYLAWIGFMLWVLSGVAFPAWLVAAGAWTPERTQNYLQFFLSQVVCGLIAATQTFFLVTCVSLRCLHPLLISPEQIDPGEIEDLLRLERRGVWYLGLAVAAPLIAFLALSLIRRGEDLDFILLFAIGIACSVFAYRLWRTIQGDVGALVAALDPFRRSGQGGIESMDSFLISSR